MANGKPWATKQERARIKDAVIATYGLECWLCRRPITVLTGTTPESFSIDHVVARNAGGNALDLANCRPAHRVCNVKRSDKPAEDYATTQVDLMEWALNLN